MALRAHPSHQKSWLLKAAKLRTFSWLIGICSFWQFLSVYFCLLNLSFQDAPCQIQNETVTQLQFDVDVYVDPVNGHCAIELKSVFSSLLSCVSEVEWFSGQTQMTLRKGGKGDVWKCWVMMIHLMTSSQGIEPFLQRITTPEPWPSYLIYGTIS